MFSWNALYVFFLCGKEVQKEGITTVQMKVKTNARLDKLGDIHKETYDDIINRIIDYYEKHEKMK
jgi:hypothetical protein